MDTWGIRGTLAAVGVAALVAGLGGTALYAATGSDAHVMGMHGNQGPPRPDGPGGAGDPFHDAAAGGSADPATALHAEFVVADRDGGYTTTLSQTGTITAVDTTSVTARSADGYVQTYVIPSAAIAAPFAVDDQVIIKATRANSSSRPTVTNMRTPMLGH